MPRWFLPRKEVEPAHAAQTSDEFAEYQQRISQLPNIITDVVFGGIQRDAELVWQFVHPSTTDDYARSQKIHSFIDNANSRLGPEIIRELWEAAGGDLNELDQYFGVE